MPFNSEGIFICLRLDLGIVALVPFFVGIVYWNISSSTKAIPLRCTIGNNLCMLSCTNLIL